ncbi:hypothetical protein Tco_0516460 [Tanacetum coccineum]
METIRYVSQEIREQMNAEAEAVQIILTGIDNDIYSTVDACPNACEMWKAIERLKQGESINVQDLETNLYWEFGKFTSRDGESLESYYSRFYKMMNELVQNQCNVIIIRSMSVLLQLNQMGKDATSTRKTEEKQLSPLLAPTYGPATCYGLLGRAKVWDFSVTTARTYWDVIKAGVQLNAEQADWKDDTDDESDDQELEAHYMYMAQLQEVTPDPVDNSGPIFDDEHQRLDLKKFQAELDKYNDVNYASKVEIDCAKAKGDLMSYKIDFEKSSNAYTRQINDLNQTISDMKN